MMNQSCFEIFMSGVLLISSIVWNECVSMKIVQQASQAKPGCMYTTIHVHIYVHENSTGGKVGTVQVYMSIEHHSIHARPGCMCTCPWLSRCAHLCRRHAIPASANIPHTPLLTDHLAPFSNILLREKLKIQWLEKSCGPKSFFQRSKNPSYQKPLYHHQNLSVLCPEVCHR